MTGNNRIYKKRVNRPVFVTDASRLSYRIEWPGLTKEEKAEGWILPCVATANSDLVLVAPDTELD